MCGTCHVEEDPAHPSALKIPLSQETCKDCHMRLENADTAWVSDAGKSVRVAPLSVPEGAGFLAATLQVELARELRARGFTFEEGPEADLELRLELRAWRVREERFVPPGTPVFCAWIEGRIRRPGEEETLFRRRAYSRPEFAGRADEAAREAVRDAFRVLSTHLVEALASH